MNSSGIKRGLATTAITALAVTGIPFIATSANAETLNNSVATADSVVVVAPDTASASTKNDGQNTTIRLQAIAGANVAQIRFEYKIGAGAYIPINTTTRNDNGSFSFEWAAAGLDGATVDIRAVGLAAGGATVTTTTPDSVLISSTATSVNITDGPAAAVFQKPDYDGIGADVASQNVSVSGTSSSTTSTPSLQYWDPSANAYAGAGTSTSTTATGATTGTWSGVLDITGYDYAAADELLVKATDVTDDAEAFALTKQVITTVTAAADRTNVPAGQSAVVTVTVKDQNGTPIVGAEVRDSDGVLIGQTNSAGQVKPTQGAGAKFYYANATASDPYEEALGDKKSDTVTVTQYAQVETSLVATSVDGSAFDFTEYDNGDDISVQIKDQNNNDVDEANRTVNYYWVNTPFDGSAVIRTPAAPGTLPATTDADGVADIPLPVVRKPGTFELFAGLAADGLGNGAVAQSKVLTVKAGEAVIKFDETAPEQAVAGTSETVSGKLVLEDGTGLAGRSVQVDYDNGAGDANIVLADNTTAGTRTVVTAADGGFSVVIRDVAVAAPAAQPTENGTVTADTVPGTPDNDDPQTAAVNQDVNFVASETAGSVVIAAETPISIDGGTKTPGRPVHSSVTVLSADQDATTPGVQAVPLTNTEVTLTLDKGFFTPYSTTEAGLKPDPAAANGADSGEWATLGQSIVVKTDNNGVARFTAAIEKDSGFDDDGDVNATVTATVGAVSDTEVIDWSSENPLNGGAVDLTFAPDSFQESAILPKAPLDDEVAFNVFVTDQFGNRVGGEDVEIDDKSNAPFTATTDYSLNSDFTATSDSAGDNAVEAEWTTDTYTYVGTVATATPDEVLTDSLTVNWYAVDFAASTYTLTHSGPDTQPVGSVVTETYTAIDQNGEPISDLDVTFFRSGPDDLQDGSGNSGGLLGQDGKITYTYQGAKAGTAIVTAIAEDRTALGSGDQVAPAELTDSVTFGNDTTQPPNPGGRIEINAVLTGLDNGAANDRLKVTTKRKAAAGATVRLFKKVRGVKVLVKTKKLNEFGAVRFIAIDRNGKNRTDYFAIVTRTDKTKGDRSNNKTIR